MVALKRMLVATDFGEAAEMALAYGRELARTFGAQLDVLHVADNALGRGVVGEGYMVSFTEMQQDVEASALKNLERLIFEEDRQLLGARTVLRTSASPAAAKS